MASLPTIHLDTTLADLYRRASLSNAHKRIAQVLCCANSVLELTSNFPRNSKYIFHDRIFNDLPSQTASNASSDTKLKRQLAMKYLSLISQRDAFISGDTPVVLFNLDESAERVEHDRREAERTMAVLASDQRPHLIFCPGPAEIPIKEEGIDVIAYKFVLDGVEKNAEYNLLISPETHWFLNSKAALARSGLPSPRCEILELEGDGGDSYSCCLVCRKEHTGFVIPQRCTGARGRWLAAQSEKVYAALASRPLPFVVKNQQTFGGAGTYIISTEYEREELIRGFRGGVLRRLLSSVTADNRHLRPASLVFSDMVSNPIGNYGITFFVPDNGGETIFLAASEQIMNGDNAWIGSTIDFDRQDELKREFGPLVEKTSRWLQRYGYIGPAGADVLETAVEAGARVSNGVDVQDDVDKDARTEFPNFHIVDLNVRTSGSICLPLLRSHFTSRGLQSASSFAVSVGMGRDAFIKLFREDLEAGRMCIVSWYEDPDSEFSLADVVVGAEDRVGLGKAMQRVRDASDEVTF